MNFMLQPWQLLLLILAGWNSDRGAIQPRKPHHVAIVRYGVLCDVGQDWGTADLQPLLAHQRDGRHFSSGPVTETDLVDR